jgi:hypothetical protein
MVAIAGDRTMNSVTTLDLSQPGTTPLNRRLQQIANPDATTLMVSWMKTVDEGNRRGIMAGLDGAGNPMAAVTYRPKPSALRATASQQNNPKKGARRGAFAGLGNHAAGLNNNLTSAEYRRLGGPPLAPRGMFSRVITNFKVDYAMLRAGYWQVTYWWDDVVSRTGVPFLRYHFEGKGRWGRIPVRDLRGIRPADREKIDAAKKAWMYDQVRSAG